MYTHIYTFFIIPILIILIFLLQRRLEKLELMVLYLTSKVIPKNQIEKALNEMSIKDLKGLIK
ncbi:hypothetical protein [Clostridium luticellarii]|uniref:Uncharacterized protein n=1 Tax=Clostridium luticellarii TaxID=1691940 RepID=A0A2T0BQ54_9CLOT|nr:hypothetical protein [Clostridium luticellarii]PRR86014.1 hypothetical protein CLLU_10420 [Clostridium luticellarii]